MIAFGKKVSADFRAEVSSIALMLGCTPDDLMLCMGWESGCTFSPSIQNAAGSGAVGLIQFMPQTAAALGTSTFQLAHMTAEAQLHYVRAYFAPWRGKLHNLGDLYMAILWPAAIGKLDSYQLFNKATGPKAYMQNHGLDFNADGKVTRGEAYAKVEALRSAGMKLAA